MQKGRLGQKDRMLVKHKQLVLVVHHFEGCIGFWDKLFRRRQFTSFPCYL